MAVFRMKSLPFAYQHVIETLNITTTDVDLKFDELCNEPLQQDRWKKQCGSSIGIEGSKYAFVANVKRKDKWQKKRGQASGEDSTRSPWNIVCHYCGKARYITEHCKKRLVGLKTSQGGPQEKANVMKHIGELSFFAFMTK